ncbi:Pvc16 family protein [Pelatocladus sp. BLCC-F211]|uniref:Pvc16 family protein n=1 Tax=Pelatocladus sp. BLCC-F211 TaxID=3342752 RepID=UPI0035B89873
MLIFVLQTLAEILAGGTSLTSTEQVDFSHPGNIREEGRGAILNLYVYDIRESKQLQHSGRQVERRPTQRGLQPVTVNWSPSWFDVSLLLTAWDRTTLGEHLLLTEALTVLLRHRSLREEFLVQELRDYGNLSMTVSLEPPIEVGSLWSALSLPLRPALYLTVPVPFETRPDSVPLVWERIISMQNQWQGNGDSTVVTKRVAIAGIVKNSVTNLPIAATEITVIGTEKSALSNQEGLFFFEDLHLGNYILRLNCPDYLPQNVNVLVDSPNYTFKEILLTPA